MTAITDYSSLVTAVQDYLKRSDLPDKIDRFIALTEKRIDNDPAFRTDATYSETTLTATIGDDALQLPDDCLELKRISYQSDRTPLYVASDASLNDKYTGAYKGKPGYYAFTGGKRGLTLMPAPDSAYVFDVHYYAALSPLTSSNTVNDLLTAEPSIYLSGVLAEAYRYLRNEKMQSYERDNYNSAKADYLASRSKRRYSGSPLIRRPIMARP